MTELFNSIIKNYLKLRYRRIEKFKQFPKKAQLQIFQQCLKLASRTEYGEKYNFQSINSYTDYKDQIPLVEYNDIQAYIHRMMMGETNVLIPEKIQWFSKSSGTSSGKSKYIPVSKRYLIDGHVKSSWDVVTMLYKNDPSQKIFADKNLIMGGSIEPFSQNPQAKVGDISGIMIHNMPAAGRPFYTPDFKTAVMTDWDLKLDQMVKICSQQDVVMFGGVPTWVMVLFDKVLDYTGKDNISEVWPNISTYIHGGVNIEPYRNQITKYIPEKLQLMEVYNASEGYFAIQENPEDEGMLLLLDNCIFYEFIAFDDYQAGRHDACMIDKVSLGVRYVIVISNTSGLYRYVIGDTITFVSIDPYKIIIDGRISSFINVFGEELMVSNTEKALAKTLSADQTEIKDYTVGPIFLEKGAKGGHEWYIEFGKKPQDLEQFADALDHNLQEVNSDYEAKRFKSMALNRLQIKVLPAGTFDKWLRTNNKIGGQSKVPRLYNDRSFLDELDQLL